VVDLLRATIRDGLKATLIPVTLTGGSTPHATPAGLSVPKKELVGVLQNQRLKVSEARESEQLLKELRTFRVKLKPVTGNESFEAWRESDHDDLVSAAGLPCWYAEKGQKPPATLKIYPYRGGSFLSEKDCRPRLKIVVCSREPLVTLAIPDHPALLVSVADPPAQAADAAARAGPATGLPQSGQRRRGPGRAQGQLARAGSAFRQARGRSDDGPDRRQAPLALPAPPARGQPRGVRDRRQWRPAGAQPGLRGL
jgi:hypothetical protein